MNITQTVDIPVSRKLTIDVPPGVPTGRVVISYEPVEPRPRKPRKLGCLKGQIWMADDFDAPLEDFKDYM
jgi:hypothetical protein